MYRYGGSTFPDEVALLRRFLDDFRAAEAFGAEVLDLWAKVAWSPLVRGGLRTIAARERTHSELLATRLEEIGGERCADLTLPLKEAARDRLGSVHFSDLDKLGDLVARYPDVEAAVRPIRDVIAQIEDDHETRGLLSSIVDEEIATFRWLVSTWQMLMRRYRAWPPRRSGNGSASS